jgi:hypothetical protein
MSIVAHGTGPLDHKYGKEFGLEILERKLKYGHPVSEYMRVCYPPTFPIRQMDKEVGARNVNEESQAVWLPDAWVGNPRKRDHKSELSLSSTLIDLRDGGWARKTYIGACTR